MKQSLLLLVLIFSFGVAAGWVEQALPAGAELPTGATPAPADSVVVPDPTYALQFRLYTNASPDSSHLFNTFDLEAYGERLLQSSGGKAWQQWLATSPSNVSLHNIVVNGEGPALSSTNHLTLLEQASGPEWQYLAWDASAAYRGRLEKYKRGLLFVAPDLFILYDRFVAQEPVKFQMALHLPAATRLDTNWGDLHLDLPKAALTIHAPGLRRDLRSWQRVESPVDKLMPGTVTMLLGPTNKLAELDLLTVFAVSRGGEKKSYAFKLLLSNNAVGARIHRDGLPTLVAFKTDAAATNASLTGFGFSGPVGVDVFKPKRKRSP